MPVSRFCSPHVRFLNPYDGWLTTGNGDLLHTVDGGETWQQLSNTELAWWGWQGMEAFSDDYLILATASEVINWRSGGRTAFRRMAPAVVLWGLTGCLGVTDDQEPGKATALPPELLPLQVPRFVQAGQAYAWTLGHLRSEPDRTPWHIRSM